MSLNEKKQMTDLLISKDAHEVFNELFSRVYDELRLIARRCMSRERGRHTLQPTALVHEAYLKLVDQTRVNWQGRTHFFAVGAMVMRRILIDLARHRRREKHGGGLEYVTLDNTADLPLLQEVDVDTFLTVHEALQKLTALDEREGRIVELRFFAGLSIEEIAEYLGVSVRTVHGDWTHARAWMRRELSERQVS